MKLVSFIYSNPKLSHRTSVSCVSLNLLRISVVPRSLTLTLFSNHSLLRSSLVPRFLLSLVSRFLHTGSFLVSHYSFLARPSCSCISLVSYVTLTSLFFLDVPCSYLARTSLVPRSYLIRSSLVPHAAVSRLSRTSLLRRSFS